MGATRTRNHGMGLGVIHPAYYRRICRDGIKKFVKFAVNVWGMSPDGGDEEELAFGGIDALQAFIHEIGLPGRRGNWESQISSLKTIADSCIRNDGGYRQPDARGNLGYFGRVLLVQRRKIMPHIAISMYPGRSRKRRQPLAEKVRTLVSEELKKDPRRL